MLNYYKIFKSSYFLKIFLPLASILLSILFIEVTFRLVEYDFDRQQSAFEALPIYYRKPIIPVGKVFFRRPGPDAWHGKVLSTMLKRKGGLDKAYINESEVTITYDKQGFRNPENLSNWDIVIVGDSFVELGYLPYDELFTTHIGRLLDVKVKNLGASWTGPLTYLFYLKQYGKSPGTKHAMMVFFEGNDIKDLQREGQDLKTFNITGVRKYRNFIKQTSFLKASYRLLSHLIFRKPGKYNIKKKIFRNAYFINPHNGSEEAVTVHYSPPRKNQLTLDQRAILEKTLSKWSETAISLGMTPWLVYLPCKRHVLDGYLSFTENAAQRIVKWRPTDLSDLIRFVSERNGIRFIDVTPELIRETRRGNQTFNHIFDSHLNRHGSSIVAQVIAQELIGSLAK